MPLSKQKKSPAVKVNRFLITITFLGSAGPIRLVVNEDDLVAAVIDTALKSYAREGRLPVLGSDFNTFMLYCPITGAEALSPWETIGSVGVRNFMLCKKPQTKSEKAAKESEKSPRISWKSWFNKSYNPKILTH